MGRRVGTVPASSGARRVPGDLCPRQGRVGCEVKAVPGLLGLKQGASAEP